MNAPNWWDLMVEAEADDKDETPEQRLATLYLTPREENIPDSQLGEDLMTDIQDLFYRPLSVIRDKVAPHLMIVIDPSYEDTTYHELIDPGTGKAYYRNWCKAPRFTFDNENDFNKWAQDVADLIDPEQQPAETVCTVVHVGDYVTQWVKTFNGPNARINAITLAEKLRKDADWRRPTTNRLKRGKAKPGVAIPIYYASEEADNAENHIAIFENIPLAGPFREAPP